MKATNEVANDDEWSYSGGRSVQIQWTMLSMVADRAATTDRVYEEGGHGIGFRWWFLSLGRVRGEGGCSVRVSNISRFN